VFVKLVQEALARFRHGVRRFLSPPLLRLLIDLILPLLLSFLLLLLIIILLLLVVVISRQEGVDCHVRRRRGGARMRRG